MTISKKHQLKQKLDLLMQTYFKEDLYMVDGKALWIGAVSIAVLYEGLLCFGLGKCKLSQVSYYLPLMFKQQI